MAAIYRWITQPVPIAPLATLRVVIGAMLLVSTLRFWALGWIDDHYVCPDLHFTYYGFAWVKVLPAWAMYGLHVIMIISAIGVMLGWYYRIAAPALFFLFTYTELIDLTYYLNHYYFVSIALLLLALTPANAAFSMDAQRLPVLQRNSIPRWMIVIFKLQLSIVYFYAGIWKINEDWLIHALPLKIWLPAGDSIPLIGPLMRWAWLPWLFSWAGMLYDTTIVGWLIWPKTRLWAYMTVIFFHLITGMLFQIGVFPLVMIGATLIFFSDAWHQRWQSVWRTLVSRFLKTASPPLVAMDKPYRASPLVTGFLVLHFVFQLLFPWRYLLYPGNIFWTEEGYRFSWRVMLMEKAGTATFYVKDSETGREGVVINRDFLNSHQEKQMAMQPDMILQFAHFLARHYQQKGVFQPQVRAEVYVTLNGRPSTLLFDPGINLALIHDCLQRKAWLSPAP